MSARAAVQNLFNPGEHWNLLIAAGISGSIRSPIGAGKLLELCGGIFAVRMSPVGRTAVSETCKRHRPVHTGNLL